MIVVALYLQYEHMFKKEQKKIVLNQIKKEVKNAKR